MLYFSYFYPVPSVQTVTHPNPQPDLYQGREVDINNIKVTAIKTAEDEKQPLLTVFPQLIMQVQWQADQDDTRKMDHKNDKGYRYTKCYSQLVVHLVIAVRAFFFKMNLSYFLT